VEFKTHITTPSYGDLTPAYAFVQFLSLGDTPNMNKLLLHYATISCLTLLCACHSAPERDDKLASQPQTQDAVSGRTQLGFPSGSGPGANDQRSDLQRTTTPRGELANKGSVTYIPTPAEYTGFRQGDWDVMIAGSGSNDKRWTTGSGSVDLSVGYFLSDPLEFSVRQSLFMADSPGNESVLNGATAVALDYHFDLGSLYPFFGANFGRVYGDAVVERWTAAPEAGLKWFLKNDAYLLAMVEYAFGFDKSSEIDDGWKEGTFVYKIGFGLRF